MTAPRIARIVSICLLFAAPLAGAQDTTPIRVAKYSTENPYVPQKPKVDELLQVSENFKYYDIDGTSFRELEHRMHTNGTKWNDGKIYAALTTWDIHYHYDTSNTDGRYAIKSVKTDVDIIYRLPRWIPAVKPAEQMQGEWDVYMDHLKEHEYGHKDLAVKAAGEINDALAALGSFSSQEALDREARKIVNARLKRMKEVQVAYDADTHHGETQGAVLP